jgi:pyridoxine 5-phosphate synthase
MRISPVWPVQAIFRRMIRLGVNLDHVATLRQARLGRAPDVLAAGHAALLGGADHVVAHLREDRRHVQDRDVRLLRDALALPLQLEMAATPEMTRFARDLKPAGVCLVPEKREERTTEGGLSVERDAEVLKRVVADLGEAGIAVSLFVDPDEKALVAAGEIGAPAVELHTGRYADAANEGLRLREHRALARAAVTAKSLGFRVHAGHGLDYGNVARVAALPEVEELNIGFSIVARAVFSGLEAAVAEMRLRIAGARATEAPLP